MTEPTTLRVSFPAPVLPRGVDACLDCGGQGVTGGHYTMPVGDNALLVDVFCPNCQGCGRADHDACTPGSHALDPDEDLDDDSSDPQVGHIGDQECYSCAGRGWNAVQGWDANDPEPTETTLLRVPCGCVERLAETVVDPDDQADRDALHGACADEASHEPPATFTDTLSTARLAGES